MKRIPTDELPIEERVIEPRKPTGKAQDEIPEPHPLPDSLLPVAPFDLALIPEKLRPWASDVYDRMQCPPDYIGVSLMAALGSIIGRKVAIRPQVHDDWAVIANQWALLIGRPGVLKSPAMEEMLRPLRKLSAIAENTLKKELAAFEVKATAAKILRDENLKKAAKILRKDQTADISLLLDAGEQSSEPTLKRYIANDTNVASLGALLRENPNGLLVFRDEIVSLLDNLDREECVGERGFYLTGWNGDSRCGSRSTPTSCSRSGELSWSADFAEVICIRRWSRTLPNTASWCLECP